MIGISSRSAGVVLIPKSEADEYAVFDLVNGIERSPRESHHLYSAAQDWAEIEGDNTDSLLDTATREYWLAYSVSHLRLALGGLEESLKLRVLEYTEEMLGSRVSSEDVLNRLLIAPLADPLSPIALAESALSHGFTAVASVLDTLGDLQPLIRRFTDHWLDLPKEVFSTLPESREMVWLTVVEKGEMSELLKASSKHDFEAKWILLAWSFHSPQSRAGVSSLGKELSGRLFPGDSTEETLTGVQSESTPGIIGDEEDYGGSDHEAFRRAEKQIMAIAGAIAKGRDSKAKKFLRQLIHEQISVSGGESYAVKSLCNIAQHCADMFRIDFELFCLEQALKLKPSDGWTLIQLGDHMKRVGKYEKALSALERARHFREGDVATSSIADVYSRQGRHQEAIRIYRTIPNWHNKSAVLTAIADNLRRMGSMDESKVQYTELIHRAQQGLSGYATCESRARAGLAEIAKKQGNFDDALSIYREILRHEPTVGRDRLFYRLGFCNVLKLMEKFKEAYSVVGNIIVEYPFFMEARFIRGSILGLMRDERQGLEDLPEGGDSRSEREWLGHYYRGLLLFRLKRYKDAKRNLVGELNKAIASEEEKAPLRMAAALWFLRENKTADADGILSEIPDLYDSHSQYLSLVLKLHSATQRDDKSIIESLKAKIATLQIVDISLDKAVEALDKRHFSEAFIFETDALLKLAA